MADEKMKAAQRKLFSKKAKGGKEPLSAAVSGAPSRATAGALSGKPRSFRAAAAAKATGRVKDLGHQPSEKKISAAAGATSKPRVRDVGKPLPATPRPAGAKTSVKIAPVQAAETAGASTTHAASSPPVSPARVVAKQQGSGGENKPSALRGGVAVAGGVAGVVGIKKALGRRRAASAGKAANRGKAVGPSPNTITGGDTLSTGDKARQRRALHSKVTPSTGSTSASKPQSATVKPAAKGPGAKFKPVSTTNVGKVQGGGVKPVAATLNVGVKPASVTTTRSAGPVKRVGGGVRGRVKATSWKVEPGGKPVAQSWEVAPAKPVSEAAVPTPKSTPATWQSQMPKKPAGQPGATINVKAPKPEAKAPAKPKVTATPKPSAAKADTAPKASKPVISVDPKSVKQEKAPAAKPKVSVAKAGPAAPRPVTKEAVVPGKLSVAEQIAANEKKIAALEAKYTAKPGSATVSVEKPSGKVVKRTAKEQRELGRLVKGQKAGKPVRQPKAAAEPSVAGTVKVTGAGVAKPAEEAAPRKATGEQKARVRTTTRQKAKDLGAPQSTYTRAAPTEASLTPEQLKKERAGAKVEADAAKARRAQPKPEPTMPASEAERAAGRTTKSAAPGAEVKATVKVRKPGKVKAPKAKTTKVTQARVVKADKDLKGAKAAAAVGDKGPTDAELRAIEKGESVEAKFKQATKSVESDERALSPAEKKARAAESKPPEEVGGKGYRLKPKRASAAGSVTEAEAEAAVRSPKPESEVQARRAQIESHIAQRGVTKGPSPEQLANFHRQYLSGEITEAQYTALRQGKTTVGVGSAAQAAVTGKGKGKGRGRAKLGTKAGRDLLRSALRTGRSIS